MPHRLIFESFRRNAQANANLLRLLTMEDLALPVHGGAQIWKILAHMHYARPGWLAQIAPGSEQPIPPVAEGGWTPARLTATSIAGIDEAFRLADQAAANAVRQAINENRNFVGHFQSHPAHFLQLMIVHDGNHRGQIMPALRLAGARSPEQWQELQDAVWDPWFA